MYARDENVAPIPQDLIDRLRVNPNRPGPEFNPLPIVQRIIENKGFSIEEFESINQELAAFRLPAVPNPRLQPDLFEAWVQLFTPPERGRLSFQQLEIASLLMATDRVLNQRTAAATQGQAAPVVYQAREESSENWSGGYVTPYDGIMFTEIRGGWQVPTLAAPPPTVAGAGADGTYVSSIWVGLDGQRRYFDSSLPQIGTEQTVVVSSGVPTQTVRTWFQWWMPGDQNGPVYISPTQFAAGPGEAVTCLVTATSPITADVSIKNDTTGVYLLPFQITAPKNAAGLQPRISGATAEWIVERPTKVPGDDLYRLPNYTAVLFSNCFAKVRAVNGGTSPRGLLGAKLIRMFEERPLPPRTVFVSIPELLDSGTAINEHSVEVSFHKVDP
jgi:Peptidase A4 family